MKTQYRKVFILACSVIIGWSAQASAADGWTDPDGYKSQDYSSGFQHYMTLAEKNDPNAQFMLGKMYAMGDGIRKDYLQAFKWLHLADLNGVGAASTLKRKVSRKMTRKQLSQAYREIEDYQKSQAVAQTTTEINDATVVRQVQQVLTDHRHYFEKIDGVMGARTRNGIRRYQQTNGLPEDGRITNSLLEHMRISPVYTHTPTISSPSAPHANSGWDDNSAEEELDQLKRKLRKIIRRAKNKDAAEPWVIDRLQRLAAKQSRDWSRTVLHEDFIAKNYRGGEAWRIVDGNFRIEKGKGLVTTSKQTWGTRNPTFDDIALSLLETLLNKSAPSQSVQKFAKIQNNVTFGSAFDLRVKTGPLKSTQGLIFSCTSKNPSTAGYQLVFHPGQGEQAKLFKMMGNNATEIKTYSYRVPFDRNVPHTFEWKQSTKGGMKVLIDGHQILKATLPQSPSSYQTLGIAHVGERVVFKEILLSDSGK